MNFNSSLLRARLNVQRIQVIDPFINRENIYKPYDRLPQFSFNTNTALPLGFELALKGELTAFDRELDEARLTAGLIERGALVTGERATLERRLSWSTVSPGWFVRANASYQHTQYQLENQAIGTLENPNSVSQFTVWTLACSSTASYRRRSANAGAEDFLSLQRV